MATQTVFLDNDTFTRLRQVKNVADGSAITSGTVELTWTDAVTGVEVPGITWPVTLTFASEAADGAVYTGVVDKAVQLVEGNLYLARTVLSTPTGIDASWDVTLLALRR